MKEIEMDLEYLQALSEDRFKSEEKEDRKNFFRVAIGVSIIVFMTTIYPNILALLSATTVVNIMK